MTNSLFTALNRLAKWRAIFAGWQLGTRVESDPECQAVRDHREITLMLRVEVIALVTLLVDKGVITTKEWDVYRELEVAKQEADLEERFPGAEATDFGMSIDLERAEAWMSKFPR